MIYKLENKRFAVGEFKVCARITKRAREQNIRRPGCPVRSVNCHRALCALCDRVDARAKAASLSPMQRVARGSAVRRKKGRVQSWENSDGQLIGWYRSSQQGEARHCILLFHGNA